MLRERIRRKLKGQQSPVRSTSPASAPPSLTTKAESAKHLNAVTSLSVDPAAANEPGTSPPPPGVEAIPAEATTPSNEDSNLNLNSGSPNTQGTNATYRTALQSEMEPAKISADTGCEEEDNNNNNNNNNNSNHKGEQLKSSEDEGQSKMNITTPIYDDVGLDYSSGSLDKGYKVSPSENDDEIQNSHDEDTISFELKYHADSDGTFNHGNSNLVGTSGTIFSDKRPVDDKNNNTIGSRKSQSSQKESKNLSSRARSEDSDDIQVGTLSSLSDKKLQISVYHDASLETREQDIQSSNTSANSQSPLNQASTSTKNTAIFPDHEGHVGQLFDSEEYDEILANQEYVDEEALLIPKNSPKPRQLFTGTSGNVSDRRLSRSLLFKATKWNNVLFILIAFLVSAFFGVKFFLAKTQAVFDSISEFQINELELTEINNSGLHVSFDGDLKFHYENIENRFVRNFYKNIIGGVVGKIYVQKVEEVGVFMNLESYNNDKKLITTKQETFYKISSFSVPKEVVIDLKRASGNSNSSSRNSNINISNQEVNILEEGSSSLLKKIFSAYEVSNYNLTDLQFKLRLDAKNCQLKAMGGLYSAREFSFAVDKVIDFPIDKLGKLVGHLETSPKKNDKSEKFPKVTVLQPQNQAPTKLSHDSLMDAKFEDPSHSVIIDNDVFQLMVNEILVTNTSNNELLVNLDVAFKFKTKLFPIQDLVLNQIIWDIFVKNCDGSKLVELANVHLGNINIIQRENKRLLVQLLVGQIPNEILALCQESSTTNNTRNISVLNELLRGFFSKYDPSDKIVIYAKAKNSNNPFWLNYILSSLHIPFNLNFIKYYIQDLASNGIGIDVSDYIISQNVSKIEFHLPESIPSKDVSPILSHGEVGLQFKLPECLDNISFQPNKINGLVDASYNNKTIARVNFDETQQLAVKFDYLLRELSAYLTLIDNYIQLKDAKAINRLLFDILNSKDNDKVTLNFNSLISMNLLASSLINTNSSEGYMLKDLQIPFDYSFKPNISINNFLSEFVLEIDSISYVSSSPQNIAMVLNFRLYPPSFLFDKFSFFSHNNLFDFYFSYNDTLLGHSLVKDISLNLTEFYSNFSILVGLDSFGEFDNEKWADNVKDLLSRLISDESPAINIIGHNKSCSSSNKISEALDGLKVSIQLPEYNCPVKGDKMSLLSSTKDTGPMQEEKFIENVETNTLDQFKDENSFLAAVMPKPKRILHKVWNHGIFGNDGSYEDTHGFILSVTMHIMTSEIEFEVYNPIRNSYIDINIHSGKAVYISKQDDDTEQEIDLAHVKKNTVLRIPPGIYKSPRLPVIYDPGVGSEILRKALNRDLAIQNKASFNLRIGEFVTDLDYRGSGMTAVIRL